VGNPRWQVPAYNGGLFGRDPAKHPEGAILATIELPDSVLGPALQALLIDMTPDGVRGPVDFRSLSVREFGTIYEGLLESSLSIADRNLTLDSGQVWTPANDGDQVLVRAGEPYFHSASGERKATGSYFTPKFIVDSLVEKTLDPALDSHFDQISTLLRSGDSAGAGKKFFDFKVADLAMGSAHFLVAAVDRIEARMRDYLAIPGNFVPSVADELSRLRSSAIQELGEDHGAIAEIEDSSLLRRQVARRCIYGVDINNMAVELSRLAIWIHTFIPGLPMSTLDHNLICGNSLTGIDTPRKALAYLVPKTNKQTSFLEARLIQILDEAKAMLESLGSISEATKAETRLSQEHLFKAKGLVESVRCYFDVAMAANAGKVDTRHIVEPEDVAYFARLDAVQEMVTSQKPVHFALAFPEVFARENPGFDCLIGNPPWEKVKLEEFRFWNLLSPGLVGMSQADRNVAIANLRINRPTEYQNFLSQLDDAAEFRKLLSGGYGQKVGSGDLDLYQAFAWANWELSRSGIGRIGLVLPRNGFVGSGLASFRKEVLTSGEVSSLLSLVNSNKWVFESVHPQYSVVLAVMSKVNSGKIRFLGLFQVVQNSQISEKKTIWLARCKILSL